MVGKAKETHHGRWPGAVKNFGPGLCNIWAVKLAFNTLYFELGRLDCINIWIEALGLLLGCSGPD